MHDIFSYQSHTSALNVEIGKQMQLIFEQIQQTDPKNPIILVKIREHDPSKKANSTFNKNISIHQNKGKEKKKRSNDLAFEKYLRH